MLRIILASSPNTISPTVSAILGFLKQSRIVAEVHCIHEILDAAHKHQPDLLFYDLPASDEGMAVLRLAKESIGGMKVVVLANQPDDVVVTHLAKVPVDALIFV